MDLWTLLIGIFLLSCGIGAYIWQFSNVFFSTLQWFSPINKTILITGCDSGIGHQLAKHFHGLGCIVFATVLNINGSGAKHLIEECGQQRMHLIQMDVTNDQHVIQAFDSVNNYLKQYELEGLNALINNAGVCVFGEFDWLSWNQIQSQIEINLLGTIRVTKRFLPLIIKSKGRIINVSSVNGNTAYPGIGVYCATKFGIEGLSDVLRIELSKFDVKVIVIKPGDYARLTNIMSNHESNISEMWLSMDDNKRQIYGNYFNDYHKNVLKNSGALSPISFQKSTLTKDFEEAVLAVTPRIYIVSASFVFRVLFFMYYYLPTVFKDKLMNTIISNMFKFDVNQFKQETHPIDK